MKKYIGIDLGTSSLKGVVVNKAGEVLRSTSVSYDISAPFPNWSEQHPHVWLAALQNVLKTLTQGIKNEIYGLGIAGQMHGLVALDQDDNVIRPCILWNDGRSNEQVKFINHTVGKEKLSMLTGNIAYAGFTLPKLLWMQEHELTNFNKINKIMLPKDYLVYALTNVFATDYSDASGTLLLDVKNKKWSETMCEVGNIKIKQLPKLYESHEIVGKVLPKYNLPNCVVVAGAGDNAAAAIGTGTVNDGDTNISLGTSGTVFIATDKYLVDQQHRLHSFAHATNKWHVMGVMLSAASSREWWLEKIIGHENYLLDDEIISKSTDTQLFFLPYLSGERTPHNDVNIRGSFIGLNHQTTQGEMSKAVMEGVAFALRDSFEIALDNGISINKATITGGGAKSHIWCQIIADVLNVPILKLQHDQGAALGAAILSLVGTRTFETYEHAILQINKVKEVIEPNDERVVYYHNKYQKFKKLYPLLKPFFRL